MSVNSVVDWEFSKETRATSKAGAALAAYADATAVCPVDVVRAIAVGAGAVTCCIVLCVVGAACGSGSILVEAEASATNARASNTIASAIPTLRMVSPPFGVKDGYYWRRKN
jgi:hypothetical protein